MFKYFSKTTLLAIFVILVISTFNANADISPAAKEKNAKNQLQRAAYGVMDLQKNTISNLSFYTTNYGIFGLNVALSGTQNAGGGYWPRGSVNQYIFGGGIWLGVRKFLSPQDTVPNKLCMITYNPNSGLSWMTPGRINEAGPQPDKLSTYSMKTDPNDRTSYRVYFSTDCNKATGEPNVSSDGPSWPIWDASTRTGDTIKKNRYFGYYVNQQVDRNKTKYSKGPAIISGEDIFATYKDTDLSRYEDGEAKRKAEGYPLTMQVEQYIYSWGFGDYRDFIFLRYDLTNYSADTLYDCYLAPVMDVDIGRAPYTSAGAQNDRTKFYDADKTLNLAVQWSNTDQGEQGFGFGYLGFDFLESPAVVQYYDTTYVKDSLGHITGTVLTKNNNKHKGDPNWPLAGSIRKDKKWYSNKEQLGLVTMKNWNIAEDKLENANRYDFMALGERDNDQGDGDKRFMMATGPFHIMPKDTFRTVVGIILANTAKGLEADGTVADMAELIRKDKFAQSVYDNNFRAPTPPDAARFTAWTPLNHAITMEWDSTSEMSNDPDERGMDFMGYRLFRARRINLDTFSLNEIAGGGAYPLGKGPLGWKEVGRWSISTPFFKTPIKGGLDQTDASMPNIDDLRLLGPATNDAGFVKNSQDSMAIRVMRIGRGMSTYSPASVLQSMGYMFPVLSGTIDTSINSYPWGQYFAKVAQNDPAIPQDGRGYSYYEFSSNGVGPKLHSKLFDSILVGDIYLNSAVIKYNPMYYKYHTANVSLKYLDTLRSKPWFSDLMVGDTIHKLNKDTLGNLKSTDTIRVSIDTVYHVKTLRQSDASTTGWVIDIETKYGGNPYDMMKDAFQVSRIKDSLYKYITNAQIQPKLSTLPDFEGSPACRKIIENYFDRLTNKDFFMDIGDDNKDGIITYDEDPLVSEKMVNNLEYYYSMLAYDEGDFMQPTPTKFNTASMSNTNLITTYPKASAVGNTSNFEFISIDSNRLGSLYNFNFFAIDNQRVNQLLAGHELELEFKPFWNQQALLLGDAQEGQEPFRFGLYQSYVTLKDVTAQKDLFTGLISFELTPCFYPYLDLYSENAASVVYWPPNLARIDSITGDSIKFHYRSNRDYRQRNGSFTSGDFTDQGYCYEQNFASYARGLLGFSFNFAHRQYGGVVRPDTAINNHSKALGQTNAVTPVVAIDGNAALEKTAYENQDEIQITQLASWDYTGIAGMDAGFNNGPGVYEIEFLPGGEESVSLVYGGNTYPSEAKATVKYLNMKVKNIFKYKRVNEFGDSSFVNYPGDMPHLALPIMTKVAYNDFPQLGLVYGYGDTANSNKRYNPFYEDRLYPDPRNLGKVSNNSLGSAENGYQLNTNDFIGKYNLAAYAWVDLRSAKTPALGVSKASAMSNDPSNPAFTIIRGGGYKALPTYSGLTQGRYYLSAQSEDGLWIDFTHEVRINGCSYMLDYANAGRIFKSGGKSWPYVKTGYEFGADFQPGDKIVVGNTGGAAGFPLPNAKIKVRVTGSDQTQIKYTDDMLDGINVVPNPYFIGHQGQRSPYDAKIYFTNLPPKCTIEIYTASGQLVRKLEHTDSHATTSTTDGTSSENWDLLTTNGQRVQSQALVAIISTPDGAQTVKNFSVVVGGFKIITE
ncbi:MAG: hypothetical protein WCR42_13500 [bacterium]